MSSLPVYIPSRRVGWWPAWLRFGAVGWAVSLMLGWAYANALALVTWKPAGLLVAVVLWLLLIFLVTALADGARSRSPTVNRWAGASIGFIAIWSHWIVVLKISGRPDLAAQFLGSGPPGWLRILGELASQRSEVEGGARWHSWLLWALEAMTTIALTASIAGDSARQPYSEAKGAWAKPVFKGELVWPGASSGSFAQSLADRGTPLLLTMLPASAVATESVAAQWWTAEVEGLAVEGDPAAHWLNVQVLVQTRDDNGRVVVKKEGVIKSWQVDAGAFAAIRSRIHPADEATSTAAERSPLDEPEHESTLEHAPALEPATAPSLQPAVEALEREQFAAAFASARDFIHDADPQRRADALRLCALASSRLEDWSVAFDHFLLLFELEPTAFNALQVASTSVCAGDLGRGQTWLQEAHAINDASREMQPPRIDTAFLSALEAAGEHAAALPLLDELAHAYAALPSLDDHFVWSHGLPFFGEFLRKSLPILQRCFTGSEVVAWYERRRGQWSDDGIARLDAHLAGLRRPAPPTVH